MEIHGERLSQKIIACPSAPRGGLLVHGQALLSAMYADAAPKALKHGKEEDQDPED